MSEHAIVAGIHDMPHDAYLLAAGVSRSMLEDLAPPKTPLHFWAAHIAKKVPRKETPAMQFGTLLHSVVLSQSSEAPYYEKPDGMKFNTKAGMAWEEEHSERPIVTAKQAADLRGMREAVWGHPIAGKILEASEFERSAFVDDEGMLLKARYDALPKSGNVIFDLKSCESADLESVERAMMTYSYFKQASFYQRVARLLGQDRSMMIFGFCEKEFPHAVCLYTPTDTILEAGEMMINRDLKVLRNCMESNRWPGYSEGIEPCALPPWAMKSIENIV